MRRSTHQEPPTLSRREQRERERRADPVVPTPPDDDGRRPRGRATREPRARRSKKGPIVLASILVLVLAGGTAGVAAAWGQVQPLIAKFTGDDEPADYAGSGNGTPVEFAIVSGQVGSDIAQNLADAGVTQSYESAYSVLLSNPSMTFQPGTYTLQQQMSAQSALDALQDTANRITNKVVIPEGTAAADAYELLATATSIPIADVQAAAADYTSYGLPAEATSLEGWLFPATYELDPGKTAHDYLQDMVTTMTEHLQSAGAQPADYQKTIVFASLIQKEAGLADDYPKVARVFQNRLDQGMLLQSDATVAYGTGNTHRVTTTDEERGDANNAYNTYVHEGLPVGPISNPGDLALNAALNPADGTWLYFVTVNLDTGETAFSTTFGEHQAAVKQWQAWMREHPEYQ
nr:endolytic transglycosylase MltG [Frigoribacterium sp. VKM Ac-2836]